MARSGIVTVTGGTVTQLTNADVAGDITFQHSAGTPVMVIGTTDATTPSVADFEDGLRYQFGQGERAVTLAELFPGASYVRLWAYSVGGANVTVYHG